jgi:hypothetical protein
MQLREGAKCPTAPTTAAPRKTIPHLGPNFRSHRVEPRD